MKLLYSAVALSFVTSSVLALSPAGWRSQSIYQVLTDRFARTDGSTTATCNTGDQIYCGGTWRGIINHLDYIQNMGFTAIWISPVVENLLQNTNDGESYHGYWAQNIQSLNSNFGTAADLAALSDALHDRGMYLMVDIVVNHMAYAGCGNCVDYNVFNPFDNQSYFHPFCLINYASTSTIKTCWMGDNTVALPDLRTEDSTVRNIFNSWIQNLISNYKIDGLRLDSTYQLEPSFLPQFQAATGGMHILGEVYNGDPAQLCPYQNYVSGLLNYATYFWIVQAFQSTSGSISNLVNGMSTMKSECLDVTLLGSFTENHDVPRFASLSSDLSQAKNVIAFTILADGIPIIYAGQEQHYAGGNVPYDREATWLSGYNTKATLYMWIAALNQIRNQAIYKDSSYVTYSADIVYSDSSTIVMRKGNVGYQIVAVFSNLGSSGGSYTLTLSSSETGFTAGQAVIEVMGCTSYKTDSSGNLAVAMAGGEPRVFYPEAQLSGSGICYSTTGSTSSEIATTIAQTASSPSACATANTVAVTFNVLKTTIYSQNIKLVGSDAAIGNWNPSFAIPLSASTYTSSNPLWYGTVGLKPGVVIQYKYILIDSAGTVTWEGDPNRTLTVPAGCTTATAVNNSWQ